MLEPRSLLLDKKFVLKSPAPWKLEGDGIMLIFKFKKDWVERDALLPKPLRGKFSGGLGMLLLTNHPESPVGAYRQLLFVPGKFRKKRKQAASHCFADTEASVQNLRANWGFPAKPSPIAWKSSPKRDWVSINQNDETIFSAEFETRGFSFPFSTALFPLRLCQTWNKLKFFTRLSGSGWGKLATVNKLELNPKFFPDIRGIAPLLAIRLSGFRLALPESTFRDEFV